MRGLPLRWWGGTMPISTPADLRENSRSARQMATQEADSYFKRMWSSQALALDQLAEKIERSEVAAREPGDPMPPDDDLLRPIDGTKTVAEAAVLRERREPNEVSLLKQRLEHLQAAFRVLETSERERETRARRRLDQALRASRSKTRLLAALGHDPMPRRIFAEKLADRMLASDGMTVIWDLHVAAGHAHRNGRSFVSDMLIEIADAAERAWLGSSDRDRG